MKTKDTIFVVAKYFIFGNFFIAVVAVVMYGYTCSVFSLAVQPVMTGFVFFSTLASYSLHWYLTPAYKTHSPRAVWSLKHKKFLLVMFLVSSAGVIIAFIPVAKYYYIILPLALVTFLYSAPKLEIKPFTWLRGKYTAKTLSLTFVWLAVTVLLPLVVSPVYGSAANDTGANVTAVNETAINGTGVFLFALNRLMLILPICILFDYRDCAEDLAEGITSLVSFMNERMLNIVFALCCAAALAAAALLLLYSGTLNAVLLAVPTALLWVSYKKSKSSVSDLWFYGFLDGLMALSGLLYFLLYFFMR